MITYSKEKRKKQDYCNICGNLSELTWDHVPPKSCFNDIPIKFNDYFKGFPKPNNYSENFQNGTRYRSICSDCNNSILGSNFDIELTKFTCEVKKMFSSDGDPSSLITIKNLNLNKVARAICGHLLAAKNYYDDQCLADKLLREYFLQQDQLPSKRLKLLYWVYPYSTIVIHRDIVVKSFNKAIKFPDGLISILSAFPIAYILQLDGSTDCDLDDIFSYCSSNINETVDFQLDLASCFYNNTFTYRHVLWPCNISDDMDGAAFFLGNDRNDSKVGIRNLKI